MPASTPWWSTPFTTTPRSSRRPTLGLACAIVVTVTLVAGTTMADPPPWAPAHGARAKHQHHHHQKAYAPRYAVYPVPYGIDRGTCDRRLLSKELIGGVLGGATGGIAGTRIGKGSGRTAATIGGAVIGVLVGSAIGRSMDQADQYCVSRVLEYAPDRASVHWYGDGGTPLGVMPVGTFEHEGRYCREYQTTARIGGRTEQMYGTACRMPDGSWQIVS